MMDLILALIMIYVFGKLAGLALRASWSILKVLFVLVFLPVILIGLCIAGMIYIAFPLLIVIGIISLIASTAA